MWRGGVDGRRRDVERAECWKRLCERKVTMLWQELHRIEEWREEVVADGEGMQVKLRAERRPENRVLRSVRGVDILGELYVGEMFEWDEQRNELRDGKGLTAGKESAEG